MAEDAERWQMAEKAVAHSKRVAEVRYSSPPLSSHHW